MAGLNRVVLIGNLTDDPELRYTQSGVARARFRIAVNRRYTGSSGEMQEETTFVPIVAWGPQAENCDRYLTKGRPVAVDGRLRIDTFETQEGERRKVTEVVANNVQFLGGPPRGAPGAAPEESEEEATARPASPMAGETVSDREQEESSPEGGEEEDEGIPF